MNKNMENLSFCFPRKSLRIELPLAKECVANNKPNCVGHFWLLRLSFQARTGHFCCQTFNRSWASNLALGWYKCPKLPGCGTRCPSTCKRLAIVLVEKFRLTSKKIKGLELCRDLQDSMTNPRFSKAYQDPTGSAVPSRQKECGDPWHWEVLQLPRDFLAFWSSACEPL